MRLSAEQTRGRSAIISRPLYVCVIEPVSQQLHLHESAHLDWIGQGVPPAASAAQWKGWGVCVLTLAGSSEACRRTSRVFGEDMVTENCVPPPRPSGRDPLALCDTDVNLPDVGRVKAPCFKTHTCKCSLITPKVTSHSKGAFRSDRVRFFQGNTFRIKGQGSVQKCTFVD